MDYAKGIGIVLMVYGHIAWGVCNAGLECDRARESIVHSVLYTFHMPLFFLLAGLFLKRSLAAHGGASGLIANKFNTVAYPYAIWSLLQGGVELLFGRYKNTGAVSVQEILAFPWEPRMQFWFLYTLFWTFVLCGVAFAKVPARHHPWLLLPALAVYAAKDHFHHITNLYNVARLLPFFVIGVLFIDHTERFVRHSRPILVVSLVAAIALQWVFHAQLGLTDDDPEHWIKLPMALACVTAVMSLCVLLQRRDLRWLGTLGAASLFIYTMHTMIGVGVRAILASGLHVQSFALHTGIATVLALLIPLVIYLRFRHWVRYLFEPPRFLALRSPWQRRATRPSA
ncbi:MAG TPA: acyltransferase [Candidatus Aquabacterium excrementipullorum]|nr:acyltransferase [Candidatus Aquabacterium excrementipullorum]